MGPTGRLAALGIAWIAVLSVGLWVAGEWLALPAVVVGRSMEPALCHGDRVLVDRWTYRHRGPREGELVLFESPEGGVMIKRAAEIPPFARGRAGARGAPEEAYWLLGDNPRASRDSRRFGPVPASRIRGRVLLRYWPLHGGAGPRRDCR